MFPDDPVHRFLDVFQRLLPPFLFAVFLLAVLPFLLLTLYAHPSADDYCYGSAFRGPGFWDHIEGEYMNWKGRYTAILFTVIFHKVGGVLVTYGYVLAALLTALVIAMFFFIRSVLEDALSTAGTWLVTLGFAALYLGTMPRAAATLYWVDGASQYQLAGIFSLLAFAALLRLYRTGSAAAAAAACVLLFFAIGGTELAMITLWAAIGAMAFSRVVLQGRDRPAWAVVVVVTLVSSALLVLAPGNFVRAELAQDQHDLALAFSHAFYDGGAALAGWLSSPGLWLATAVFVPVALRLVHLKGVRRDGGPLRLAVTAALLPALIWSFYFAVWFAAANNPPGRALNLIYLVFLAGWFVMVLELVAAAARRFDLVYTEEVFPPPLRAGVAAAGVLLAAFLLFQGDARHAYADLAGGSAAAYDRQMSNRYAIVARRKEQETKPEVVLPRIQNAPRVLWYSDIQDDPGDWRNSCFARYFGLESVTRR